MLSLKGIGLCLTVVGALLNAAVIAADTDVVPLAARTEQLVASLRAAVAVPTEKARRFSIAKPAIEVHGCATYPYAEPAPAALAVRQLLDDLADGLDRGLRCLSGVGPMGRLHQYHAYQAHRLLKVFESAQTKRFQCVDDEMFATAVATSPTTLTRDDPLYDQLRTVDHPAVILDTYRLGGLLSRRHDDDTFRNFFHLAENQIQEHRNGQPLRAPNLHRYRDRGALLFHEVVHWLGHQHSAIYPDLTHLYETCCFAGSDYIDDDVTNRSYQQAACDILRDDALWADGHHPYRQMRIWHYKGYDTLKGRMRADYKD